MKKSTIIIACIITIFNAYAGKDRKRGQVKRLAIKLEKKLKEEKEVNAEIAERLRLSEMEKERLQRELSYARTNLNDAGMKCDAANRRMVDQMRRNKNFLARQSDIFEASSNTWQKIITACDFYQYLAYAGFCASAILTSIFYKASDEDGYLSPNEWLALGCGSTLACGLAYWHINSKQRDITELEYMSVFYKISIKDRLSELNEFEESLELNYHFPELNLNAPDPHIKI